MKLLFKELALSAHPTLFIFTALGCLVIVPAYPYSVIFMFGCLAPFLTTMYARETNDAWYTAILPVTKKEIVKSKYLLIVSAQLCQLVFSLPFAVIHALSDIGNNPVGMDANIAWYGIGFITFAAFDFIFFPAFYKSGYKSGKAFILAAIPLLLCIAAAEFSVHLPTLAWLDSTSPKDMLHQLPILIAGLLLYTASITFSYRKSAKRFEQVNL